MRKDSIRRGALSRLPGQPRDIGAVEVRPG